MVVQNHPYLWFQGSQHTLLTSVGTRHVCGVCRQNTYIKLVKFLKVIFLGQVSVFPLSGKYRTHQVPFTPLCRWGRVVF